MKTKIDLAQDYTATIMPDDYAENPFEAWDCQAPVAIFNLNALRVEDYGTGPDLQTLFDLLPSALFETPEGIAQVMDACQVTSAELAELLEEWGTSEAQAPDYQEAIRELLPEPPRCWGDAVQYFDAMEATARLAGLACHLTQSNGYSQGDCALVFSCALPEFLETSGIRPEHAAEVCEAACKLWGAWAWGDVYRVSNIYREDGTEVEDAHCGGYYGDDHAKSGLRDYCEEIVKFDLGERVKESARAHEAACRDIVTA